MARRKQNVDAFGKSWSPIDIPNLEKAVKLYERLNYLQDHFAGSLSSSKQIMAQINEQAEIKEELEKTGIKLTEEQTKKVLELFRIRQQENREAEKIIPIIDKGTLVANNGQYKNTTNLNGMFTGFTGNAGQSYMNRRLSNDAASALRGGAISAGRNGYVKGTNEYNSYVSEYASRKMEGAANKYAFSANLIQVAADTFSKAVQTFGRLFTNGLANQANAYEDTFTNISVRTGMTKNQYFANQMGASNTLYSRGLAGNIKMSDVQQMWNTLASTGMGQEKVLANAIETVMTQTIVPYIKDTVTTSQFQELLDQQPQLMKQVRGIGRATLEITGNSTFATQYLDQMLKDIAPMAQVAENELGVQFAKISGRYSELIAQGYNDAQIGEMYKLSAQVYNDPLAALRSGNIDQQLAVVNGITNGIDFRDFDQVDAETLKALNFVANLTPEGKMSPLLSGLSNTAASTWLKVFMNEKNTDISSILSAGGNVASILAATSNGVTNDFVNNVNNTAKQLQANEAENAVTWLARIYEQIGYWGDVLAVLVKGIAAVVGAKILGKIGGSLLGGGKGLGIGAALTSFAGTGVGYNLMGSGAALGINSIPLATAAGAAGVLGGGAMAVKGGMDIYNDLHSGEGWTGKTTASAVGAAAGVAGAGLLLASNPIGWAVLAVGGIALAGRAIKEQLEDEAKMRESSIEMYQNQVEQEMNARKNSQEDYIESLGILEEKIKRSGTLEQAKQLVIQNGIATEEEVNEVLAQAKEANIDSKDALIQLTDQYIKTTKAMNQEDNAALEALKMMDAQDKSKYTDSAKSYMDWLLGGNGWNREMYELSGQDREAAYQIIAAIAEYGESNYEGMSKKEKELYDKIKEYGIDRAKIGNDSGLTWEEVDKIIDKFDSQEGATSDLITRALGDSAILQKYSANDAVLNKYGNRRYLAADWEAAFDNYLVPAHSDKVSNAQARKLLDAFKEATYTSSIDEFDGAAKSYIQEIIDMHELGSYRSGLSYVPYDDYLASLHQGEAVITAATASELRGLLGEYRRSHQMSVSLDTAIQNQTATLVNKMDEIIQVIQSDSLFANTSETSSRVKNLFNNMRYMRSSKSFNQ